MCGIIAVVRRPSTRPTPSASEVIDLVAGLAVTVTEAEDITEALTVAGGRLAEADRLLRGVPGLRSSHVIRFGQRRRGCRGSTS